MGYYIVLYLIRYDQYKSGGRVQFLISTPHQLSQALRSVRKTRGLTQAGAGKPVGLLPKTISALENHPGSASIDSFMKLLSALELELVIAVKQADDTRKKKVSPHDKEW